MGTELLPLFPLAVVLVPAMPLPLHIFEDRYKELMRDIMPHSAEFGIVLARRDGIANIGCTATVERVFAKYPDGRLDLLAVGRRRFKIASLDDSKPYLQGEVEFFDDEHDFEPPAALSRTVSEGLRKLAALEDAEEGNEESSIVPLSFRVARLIADLDKRLTILSLRSEIERLQYLASILPGYIAQRENAALARRLAPQNGHVKYVALE
jgi:Lon protease-like protein